MACDIQCVGDSTSRKLETHIARKKQVTQTHTREYSQLHDKVEV